MGCTVKRGVEARPAVAFDEDDHDLAPGKPVEQTRRGSEAIRLRRGPEGGKVGEGLPQQRHPLRDHAGRRRAAGRIARQGETARRMARIRDGQPARDGLLPARQDVDPAGAELEARPLPRRPPQQRHAPDRRAPRQPPRARPAITGPTAPEARSQPEPSRGRSSTGLIRRLKAACMPKSPIFSRRTMASQRTIPPRKTVAAPAVRRDQHQAQQDQRQFQWQGRDTIQQRLRPVRQREDDQDHQTCDQQSPKRWRGLGHRRRASHRMSSGERPGQQHRRRHRETGRDWRLQWRRQQHDQDSDLHDADRLAPEPLRQGLPQPGQTHPRRQIGVSHPAQGEHPVPGPAVRQRKTGQDQRKDGIHLHVEPGPEVRDETAAPRKPAVQPVERQCEQRHRQHGPGQVRVRGQKPRHRQGCGNSTTKHRARAA